MRCCSYRFSAETPGESGERRKGSAVNRADLTGPPFPRQWDFIAGTLKPLLHEERLNKRHGVAMRQSSRILALAITDSAAIAADLQRPFLSRFTKRAVRSGHRHFLLFRDNSRHPTYASSWMCSMNISSFLAHVLFNNSSTDDSLF